MAEIRCSHKIEASVDYIADIDLWEREKPYAIDQVPGAPSGQITNLQIESHPTIIEDLRTSLSQPTLARHSFCFLETPSDLLKYSEQEMMVPYAEEVNAMLKKTFSTNRVITYDLRLRENRSYEIDEVLSNSRAVPSPPVTVAHVDHSREGAWMRIARHTNAEEKADIDSGKWRVRIINTWRPLHDPVEDSGLAFCDPQSIDEGDLVEVDRISPASLGTIYNLKFSPNQKWYWLPEQRPTELAVFVCYDSHPPNDVFNFCPHAAFDNPTKPAKCPPRRSVETRSMVFTPI